MARPSWTPAPAPVPMDPADLDRIPPPDLEICGVCNGNGDVPAPGGDPVDPATVWKRCSSCDGSGLAVHYWNGSAA